MRFIHAADLHVGSPLRNLPQYEGAPLQRVRAATQQALVQLADLCLREEVDFLLIAGDLFDNDWQDFGTPLFVTREFHRLAQRGIPVFVILGNHDSVAGTSRRVPWPPNVRVFAADRAQTHELVVRDRRVAIHGRSYEQRKVSANLVPEYPPPRPGCLNIGLLHTSAEGSAAHASYAPCSIAELVAKGYDYWALGHVHERALLAGASGQRGPLVAYSGNTQGRHVKEQGAKGCWLVEVADDGRWQIAFHSTDVLRWASRTVNLSAESGPDELRALARVELERAVAEADGRLAAVRLRVAGATALHAQASAAGGQEQLLADLRSEAQALPDVWLESVVWRTRPLQDVAELARTQDFLGLLLADVEQQRTAEGRARLRMLLAPLTNKLVGPAQLIDSETAAKLTPEELLDRRLDDWLDAAASLLATRLLEPSA